MIRSIRQTVDDIAGTGDIVLADNSAFGRCHGNLPGEIYDCCSKLEADDAKIVGAINWLAEDVITVYQNGNICTIQEVLDEMDHYINILNNLCSFHGKSIADRKFNGGARFRKKNGKRKDANYEPVDKNEEHLLGHIKVHADQFFRLRSLLGQRVIAPENASLLDRVINISASAGLKIDFSYRYCDAFFKGRKYEDTHADEHLVVAAYEQAVKGKGVSIVTNDSDMRRMFKFFFEKSRIFQIPQGNGYVAVYSDIPRIHQYELDFDTRFLLCPIPKDKIKTYL